ncbi:cobalamin B12-binding domain-containing protein [Sandaracinobacteroides saxicola]|uniref:Cobalamin B12-binding domain-containing protein n=1 Tax=Sandaracinobacteroides saxicola TaxID=2759707 RepID=A0A7G5IKU1_9SPHN|nr:cobalamin-dependent protein [Sandaracinobacteroides saxicola]QMW23983.1 cobalamin B12-binding domain-containing protein [Sandaracinobacteroides saxicola]
MWSSGRSEVETGGSLGHEVMAMGQGALSRVIENQIIPRLLMAHRVGAALADTHVEIEAQDVMALAEASVSAEGRGVSALMQRLLDGGVTPEALLIDLVAPAARVLGTRWEEDSLDFVDVTIGLWRLQEVVQLLESRCPAVPSGGRRALFVSLACDTHRLGTTIVADIFGRAGWDVSLALAASDMDAAHMVRERAFDVVGLTVSCDGHIAAATSLIAAVRHASQVPGLKVIVGGPLFQRDPALVHAVGADGMSGDARDAVALAQRLLAEDGAVAGRA